MRWSCTGRVSRNSLICTLCMRKTRGTWQCADHPITRVWRGDAGTCLRRTPLQILVVLHVKWALRKVVCSEYSTSNNYTHITHNKSMHCLWLTLHQWSHCVSGSSNNGLIDHTTSDSCCLLMRPHFIVMVFRTAGIAHVRDEENPHAVVESNHQVCFAVNIWAITSTWASEWPPILEVLAKSSTWVVGGRTLGCSWEDVDSLQHDDAPSHFSVDVRNHLNAVFPGCWIGREALFHGLRSHLTRIPLIIFYGAI